MADFHTAVLLVHMHAQIKSNILPSLNGSKPKSPASTIPYQFSPSHQDYKLAKTCMYVVLVWIKTLPVMTLSTGLHLIIAEYLGEIKTGP